jgi:prepilin-type N-terminal cleavage/methylation domain-containing protein
MITPRAKRGLTLMELMITVAMLVVLTTVLVSVLRAVLLSWSSEEARAGIDINIDRGVEEVVRDLREVSVAQCSKDEIRFSPDEDGYYIYYLYNAKDPYPPAFKENVYQLRKAALTGGIGGTFTYGSGDIKMIDIVPPPASNLSISGNLITIDLSLKKNDETIRSRTAIRPRNL